MSNNHGSNLQPCNGVINCHSHPHLGTEQHVLQKEFPVACSILKNLKDALESSQGESPRH